jgi:hypothetical protein
MRRQRNPLLLLALALLVAAPASLGAQQDQSAALRGTFALNADASDDVREAINEAVRGMNFITRPIARGRLARTNEPYQRVRIAYDNDQIWIKTDDRAPIVTPATGAPIKWRREDGEEFDVSTEWENGRLEQTFVAGDGQRVNTFSVSPNGQTMTMTVTISSPKLSSDLVYRLVFDRVAS